MKNTIMNLNYMQERLQWFLKTTLQHQLFFDYLQPSPKHQEIQSAVRQLNKRFSLLDLKKIGKKLFKEIKSIKDISLIMLPLAYSQIVDLYSQIQSHLQAQNSSLQQHNQPISSLNAKEKKRGEEIMAIPRMKLSKKQEKQLKIYSLINQPCPVFHTKFAQRQYEVKRHIARSFVQKGYGMSYFRDYCDRNFFEVKIQFKKYSGMMTSLVLETFRSIQKFLESHCSLAIFPLSRQKIRILYTILLNIKQLSTPEDYQVFQIFLTSLYNLSKTACTNISGFSVYQAYQSFLSILCLRQKEIEKSRESEQERLSVFNQKKQKLFCLKNQPDKDTVIEKWNPQKELQLAELYIKLQDFLKVRDKYRQMYGSITMFEDIKVLRSYLYKIIRKSLRRAQKVSTVCYGKYSKEQVENLHLKYKEFNTQYVFTSPEFLKARVLLCNLYLNKDKSFELIAEIATELKAAIESRNNTSRKIYHFDS